MQQTVLLNLIFNLRSTKSFVASRRATNIALKKHSCLFVAISGSKRDIYEVTF